MIGHPRNKRSETSIVDKEKAQMKAPRTLRNLPRFLGVLVAAAALTLALGVGSASAAFGIESFDGEMTANEAGTVAATQSASHPYEAKAEINVNSAEEVCFFGLFTCLVPEENFKDVEVKLPPGFVGDPQAVPQCGTAEFLTASFPTCAKASIVGKIKLKGEDHILLPQEAVVYNLVPGPGEPARFGFRIITTAVNLRASVRTGGDYGLTVKIPNTTQAVPVIGTELTFWGVPGDSSHNADRGGPFEGTVKPFLSLPTSCSGPVLTSLRINSWGEPNVYDEASFLSHNAAAEPIGVDGCDKVSFEPSLRLETGSHSAASPTGLSATLKVPQHNDNPKGLVSSHLKKAVVKLPEGVRLNPAAANGLSSCSEAQIGLNNDNPVSCPNDSKVGTTEIVSPLLSEPMKGSLYQAEQNNNPFSSLVAVYLVAEAQGVTIKQAGKVELDPNTGQVTATFEDVPQQPFSDLKLSFFGGPQGILVNSNSCGPQTYTASFTSWSGQTVNTTGSFDVNQNCDTGGFDPKLDAGTTNPVGGDHSPFVLDVTRNDGEQNVAGINVDLPKGLLAKPAGIPLCSDADAGSGNCPAASQVGVVNAAAGAGPSPVLVPQPGKDATAVYLAGAYKGAPYSIVAKVPAQAGPFDLGTVAVRSKVNVDPETAQISVESDSLPQILKGIPIDYREVQVNIDKPDFMLNPTSCEAMSVDSSISSDAGAVAHPSSRFQVGSCGDLDFNPKLYTRIWGNTNRGAHPKLRAVLKMPSGGANIGRVAATLPHSEFLDQAHIKTICTRVQFAANACPTGSVYGYAKAWTPLLDQPLQGPVYLRSSSHKLPDLVADLNGQIHIVLDGRIDSVHRGIRTTFEGVPDAPVSTFILYMKGGKKGLLQNSTNICKGSHRSIAKFNGQNGKRSESRPPLKNSRCHQNKRKAQRSSHRNARRAQVARSSAAG